MPKNQAYFHRLEQCFIRNYDMLYRLASHLLYRYTNSSADAADIVQQAFLHAVDKWDTLSAHPEMDAWLTKTTRYLCMNHIRSHYSVLNKASKASRELLNQQPAAYGKLYTGAVEQDTDAQDLLMLLEDQLSPEDFELIKALCLDHYSYQELSQQTGISEATLRVRLHRIRKNISIFFICLVTILLRQNI